MEAVQVYCWRAVRPALLAGLSFDPHEQQRRSRLRFATLTERFDHAHAGLRIALGDALNCDPASLQFQYSALGKPALLHPSGMHFSLSHAGQYCMLAVGACPLGLDLEMHQAGSAALQQLIPYVMQPAEQQRLANLSEAGQICMFYRHWVAKEALMKHAGLGLQLPPQAIFIRDDFCAAEVAPAWEYQLGTDWCLQELKTFQGYSAALCTPHPVRVVSAFADGLL